jgi:hypothetical protein
MPSPKAVGARAALCLGEVALNKINISIITTCSMVALSIVNQSCTICAPLQSAQEEKTFPDRNYDDYSDARQ